MIGVGYAAGIYGEGTPLVGVVFTAMVLAAGKFMYLAGKRTGLRGEPTGRETAGHDDLGAATGSGSSRRRGRTLDYSIIASMAVFLLARPTYNLFIGVALLGEWLWIASLFGTARIVYVAGKRSVRPARRRSGDATRTVGRVGTSAPWPDLALTGLVVAYSALLIWHAATGVA